MVYTKEGKKGEKMSEERKIVDSVESLEKALVKIRKAQKEFGKFNQEQVDNQELVAINLSTRY